MSPTILSVDVTGAPVTIPAHPPLVTGALWAEIRPDLRRLHVLAGDLLAALGKRRDLAGTGRNEQDDVRHALAWMCAHDIADVVLTEAQRLHPVLLNSLVRLTDTAGARLWLLHRPPRSDTFVRALGRRRSAATADLAAPSAAPAPHLPVPVDLPAVPAAEFTTFRSAYRRTLSAADAARVDAVFSTTARDCTQGLRAHGATRGTVADLLYGLLNPAPPDAQLTVQLRALQAAAWHHDLYVKIDLARLLHGEERPRIPAAVADAALAPYRQPYRPITVMLTRNSWDLASIGAIRISDAAGDGATLATTTGRVSFGPHTARAVRAQVQLRRAAGAEDNDPLLPHSPKALAKALTEAATDLGLHVHGRRAERTRDHTEGALRALGVTVEALP
ncbi:hypothetical protein JKP75_13260 [Blastococcus sp. TML/M2B]|uniref:hypothetical protein n=1 Tax=unclassified Blastococcus TaxID=2619396 RepID=UPI00190A35FB|nr:MULTISPECIES: hypothetical protein [unclassified Blastococcus]MBN1093446.1 hypothetical protein [Blastococcus sp. TML/M2B]MBN1096437.1 hypothetical protein [Blastococcus sp. TML/C7B]